MRHSLKIMAAALAIGTSVLGSSAAEANPISFFYSLDGGTTFVQFGTTSTTGINSANTTVGTYTISASATGSPVLTAPNFQSTSIDAKSTGAGTLIVAAVESGLTTPGLSGFSLGFTNNSGSTTSVMETFGVLNSSGTLTTLATQTLAPNTATNSMVNYVPPSNYSVAEAYTITFGASGGVVNATISESGTFPTSVPEPMSLSLLGIGMAGLGVVRLRRKA